MGAESAFLGEAESFIPSDGPVGADLEETPVSLRFDLVDDDNAVWSLVDCPTPCRLDAGGIVTVHAGGGQIGDIDKGILSPLFSLCYDPALALVGHRCRISRPIIVDVLILAGQKTIFAVFTFLNIYDHVPAAHFEASIFSISTRQEFAAKL
jgi:hypothetical protein